MGCKRPESGVAFEDYGGDYGIDEEVCRITGVKKRFGRAVIVA
jgi:hypothetical protein